MRRAAAGWINHCSRLEVCGMAGGSAGAFKAIRHLQPDLVVSEIARPQDIGFIRELHRRRPHLPILALTIRDAAVHGAQAREAGASRYVMKDAGGEELIQNILTTLRRRGGASGVPKKLNMKSTTRRIIRRPQRSWRILIVNGVTIWRKAFWEVINRAPDLTVCGAAFDEKSAWKQVHRIHPHLVLSEILRPQDLGFIHALHRRHPGLPILTFSFRDDEAYAPRALAAGACGYFMKNIDGETLVAGVRKALNGQRVSSLAMERRLHRPPKRRQTERSEVGRGV